MSYEGTQEELEEMLASGGPTWERVLKEIFAGGEERLGVSAARALELEGLERVRVRGFLARNKTRAKEIHAAEEIRDERITEALKAENLKIAMAPIEGPGAVPVSTKVKALEISGRDYGVFKDDGLARVADSLEAIMLRAASRTAEPARVVDEKPNLRVAGEGN